MSDESYINLGGLIETKIEILLRERGEDWSWLRQRLGLSRQTLCKELRRPRIQHSLLRQLAAVLQISISELVSSVDIKRLLPTESERTTLTLLHLTHKESVGATESLTVEETSEALGLVGVGQIYKKVKEGILLGKRIGKRLWIDKASVDRYLEKQQRERQRKRQHVEKERHTEKPAELQGLITLREACAVIGVRNRNTVLRHIHAKGIEPPLWKNRYYVDPQDLEDYQKSVVHIVVPPGMITVDETKKRLGIQRRATIKIYLREKRLRGEKVKNQWFVYEDSVEEYRVQREANLHTRNKSFTRTSERRRVLSNYFRKRPHRGVNREEIERILYQHGIVDRWDVCVGTINNMCKDGEILRTRTSRQLPRPEGRGL